MITYSLYNLTTGIVTSNKTVLNQTEMDATFAAINNPNRDYIEGKYTPEEYYIKNDQVFSLPPKSDPWLTWNLETEQWEDNRTTTEVSEQLNYKRLFADLTKRELCLELVRRNILSQEDAITASKGDWPSTLQPFWDQINTLDPLVATEVLIEWAGSNTVNRLDTNILTIASLLAIDESTLDDIFKVNV